MQRLGIRPRPSFEVAMSEKWAKRIALVLVAVPAALFVSNWIWRMEGSASNGKVVDGRYYVRTAPGYREISLEKGYQEVSEETWRLQYRREVALRTSFGVVLFALIVLSLCARVGRDRPRPPDPARGADGDVHGVALHPGNDDKK